MYRAVFVLKPSHATVPLKSLPVPLPDAVEDVSVGKYPDVEIGLQDVVESTDFLVSNQRDNALLKSVKKLMINTVYYLIEILMLNFVLDIM
jgi:hypothetical protein